MKAKLSPEEQLLKDFMLEQFDFDGMKELGFYGKDIKRRDFKKQAERVCTFFGFKTVYEYGSIEGRCHISYVDPDCPSGFKSRIPLEVDKDGLKEAPFVTVIKNIYD